jgi:serine/threonine protein kinase
MGSSMNEEKQNEARKIFNNLQLADWQEVPQTIKQGGEAAVLVVRHKSDKKGVFRHLRDTDEKANQRFHRELKILTEAKLQHPSIIKLLAYTTDERPWYISELGEPFDNYWRKQRERLQNQPDEIIKLAITHIIEILEGLAPLHDVGVIHRDIKPQNIVVLSQPDKSYRAVLIDFGIAFFDDEPRLTDLSEAPGNKRYSPDQMMNRMDNVPPWLDVFELSQVLIWMVRKMPVKHYWDRPLHWRWVEYNDRLSDDFVLSLRALTSLCSEQSISPQNGNEMIKLVYELFPLIFAPPNNIQKFSIDADRIQKGISRGKAIQYIKEAEDEQIISGAFETMDVAYKKLHESIEALYQQLKMSGIAVRKETEQPLQNLLNQVLSSADAKDDLTLYQMEFGEQFPQTFRIRVNCLVYKPSFKAFRPSLPESANPFVLYLERFSNPPHGRVQFPHRTKVLTVERNGTLILRDEHFTKASEVTVLEVIGLITQWINDEEAWEIINQI